MPDLKDYHAYKSTKGSSGGAGGFGGGKVIVAIVVIMLICFLFSGAGWEAIETLLALGLIAYLLFRQTRNLKCLSI